MNVPEPTPASSAGAVPMMAPCLFKEDDDYALGFECANPVLQIERWGQEASSGSREYY